VFNSTPDNFGLTDHYGRVGVGTVLLLVAAAAWGCGRGEPASSPSAHTLYACSDEAHVRTTAVGTDTLRLTLPSGATSLLARRPAASGTLYAAPSHEVALWTKDRSAVVYRAERPLNVGCVAVPDSQAQVGGASDSGRAWFRSPALSGGYSVTMRHRRDADVAVPAADRVRVRYVGPANEPPALTDGFTVTIRIHEGVGGEAARAAFVERSIASTARVGGEVLRPPRDTTFQSRPALWWRQESAMGGTVTHWAVRLDGRSMATVATSLVGTDTAAYRRRIRALRRSLAFGRRPATATDSMTVPLALLARPDGSPERGCDDVVVVPRRVPCTDDPLTAALEALFALPHDSLGGARHFLVRTRKTLSFDRARRVRDTAHVYLTGALSGLRGVCDNPRARIQIQETARRAARADTVVLYLNGTRTQLRPERRDPRSQAKK
jgi:hypothetical protein